MTLHELCIKCITTIGFVLAGKLAPLLILIQTGHIPPILIECFQIGSYSTAMIVGIITVYKFFKKK
jgi:hypothetical protein